MHYWIWRCNTRRLQIIVNFHHGEVLVIVPKTTKFPCMVTKEVALTNGLKKTKASGTFKPRAWRWLNSKPLSIKSLMKIRIQSVLLGGCSSQHCSGCQWGDWVNSARELLGTNIEFAGYITMDPTLPLQAKQWRTLPYINPRECWNISVTTKGRWGSEVTPLS